MWVRLTRVECINTSWHQAYLIAMCPATQPGLQYTIFPNIASSQRDLTGTIVRSFWLRTGDKIHYNSASVVSIMVIMIIINKQKGFRIWITMVIHIFWTWLFICIITSQHWLLHILNGDGWWLWSDVRAILEPWTLNDYNYYGRIIISFEIYCGEICIFQRYDPYFTWINVPRLPSEKIVFRISLLLKNWSTYLRSSLITIHTGQQLNS